eukprot:13635_1
MDKFFRALNPTTLLNAVADNRTEYDCPVCGERVWAYGGMAGTQCLGCPGYNVAAAEAKQEREKERKRERERQRQREREREKQRQKEKKEKQENDDRAYKFKERELEFKKEVYRRKK